MREMCVGRRFESEQAHSVKDGYKGCRPKVLETRGPFCPLSRGEGVRPADQTSKSPDMFVGNVIDTKSLSNRRALMMVLHQYLQQVSVYTAIELLLPGGNKAGTHLGMLPADYPTELSALQILPNVMQ